MKAYKNGKIIELSEKQRKIIEERQTQRKGDNISTDKYGVTIEQLNNIKKYIESN